MAHHQTSAIGKQEAVRVGNVIVIAQHDHKALEQQKQHLFTKGYRVHNTHHFVVCQHPLLHRTVLLHLFRQAEIDADLICFIQEELGPFGIIPSAQEFSATLFAVLASTFPSPRDQQTIWQHFTLKSLSRLREQIVHPVFPLPEVSYIAPFATIYRRVFDLYTGQSLLDVGCSFGFLPVLMAERLPNASIVGCDKNPDALHFSTDLAQVVGTRNVRFALQDILDKAALDLGTFDTVTALHLLEHLSESDVSLALTHLLALTARRLIIAVPYEQQATAAYGHLHVFTPQKLEQWGMYCVEKIGNHAHFWCEQVAGGLLVIDVTA